jgi:NADH-quinone oxidoreductase subunit L
MSEFFDNHPGYFFVVATILPLASFVLLFLTGGVRWLLRRYRDNPRIEKIYEAIGADKPSKVPAYIATAAIALAFVFSITGCIYYLTAHGEIHTAVESLERDIQELRANKAPHHEIEEKEKALHDIEESWEREQSGRAGEKGGAWKGNLFELVHIRPAFLADPSRGTTLEIGFAIDSLSALMFVMVTFIATLIHIFSMGYMAEELAETVEDHQVDVEGHHWAHAEGHTEEDHGSHGRHLHRRGRYGRFFMFLSLFCFSMLNLVLANNLFQVFVSWELVGICSYLLIGFYFERRSASNAANKAFITNRVGDAGFIIGLLIFFAYVGTFNFDGIFNQVRHPLADAHGEPGPLAGRIVRANVDQAESSELGKTVLRVTKKGEGGDQAVLFPAKPAMDHEKAGHFDNLEAGSTVKPVANRKPEQFGSMPYWMLVLGGLGIFLGCVGKSAQFPLQVWLPDAMEGPTPVSALIHAATMVAAGVYLVGRCYPLFTPEALLVIAYTGAITLFVAATIAVVMTDIKKVLAYSTVSQLGYMMLALGIGGWVAGLFHLMTHAFFKALLFLCSGSVIYGCHHEQEMTKMGGLYPKMKITAITMLIGVLTIAGIPMFSGWYSKDSIIAQAAGYAYVNRGHALLFILPLVTAGITTFYMFRMWFLTFTGEPRDQHVHEHAHESPALMTVPLIALAVMSVVVAWGWPVWDATASELERTIHHAQPPAVLADFGHVIDEGPHGESWPAIAAKEQRISERHYAHEFHETAGMLALGMVGLGIIFAAVIYYARILDPAEAKEQFPAVHAFLINKWYFDELYSVVLVRPAMIVARAFRAFDLKVLDGVIHAVARGTVGLSRLDGLFDHYVIDGLVNLVGRVTWSCGAWMRTVQTGSLRSYVLFLVLAAVGIFILLSYFVTVATAG